MIERGYKMKAEQIIQETKRDILEQIRDKLKDIDTETEVYFHDIVSEEIDSNTPTDRQTCLNLIDLSNPEHFDEGLIDKSSLDRMLITMSYCSLEENLFNDDLIQELQNELNNEKISKRKAKELIIKIDEHLETEKKRKIFQIKDTAGQIFINTNFSINSLKERFKHKPPKDNFKHLKPSQFMDLSDSIKILSSNKNLNQNAIVITEKKRDVEKKVYEFRVYLMEKDKDIDIRNFFKLKTISKETGFNLSPRAYIEQTTEEYEKEKSKGETNYQTTFKDIDTFIYFIEYMANKLTEISISGNKKTTESKIKVVEVEN